MIAHILAVARDRGAHAIHLQVNKRNIRAQRAYQRAGFTVVESAVFEIGGGYVMDDLVMECTVPSAFL